MSTELDDENVLASLNNIENKNETPIARSRSHDEKNSLTSENFRHISVTYEDHVPPATVSQVENDGNSTTPSFGLSGKIENEGYDHPGNFNQIRDKLRVDGKGDRNHEIHEKRDDCADECVCKIQQALALIVEEIKKVGSVIRVLATKGECPYTPGPDDKKEFAKSVQKNSSVCHVIIQELKNQRTEIDEMLELYESSTRDFDKLECTLTRQREKVQHVQTVLGSIEEVVKNVKIDMGKRHENFFSEIETRRVRAETREEILRNFVDWISSLDVKRFEERKKLDLHIEEAIFERNEDRMMLTLAVKQLQEVRKIEMLINLQSSTKPHNGGKDRYKEPITVSKPLNSIPPTFCRCALPIKGFTIPICNQRNEVARNCAPNATPALKLTMMRCAGGADVCGATQSFCTEQPEAPSRCHNNIYGLCTKKRRLPVGRRKSPPNYSRRQIRKLRNIRTRMEKY